MAEDFFQDEPKESGLGEHLEVLRAHLIRILIVFFFFTVLAFIFKSFIFDFIILKPLSADFPTNSLLCKLERFAKLSGLCIENKNYELINIQVSGQFMLHLTVSLALGFLLAFPYILFEFWKFVRPALTGKEKKAAGGFVIYASLMFFAGVVFGYFIITPMAFNFFENYMVSPVLKNQFIIQSYISMLTRSCLAAGIAFELPLFVYILSHAGLTTPKGMKKYRRHAVVALFIIAAILTPADPLSMFMVAIPLLLLYEFSIGISRRVEKKAKKDFA